MYHCTQSLLYVYVSSDIKDINLKIPSLPDPDQIEPYGSD